MSLALVLAVAAALVLIVAFAPPRTNRPTLLAQGAVGLAAMVAIAIAPNLDLVLLIFLTLVGLQALLGGRRSLDARLRAPLLAVVLVALGLALARAQGSSRLPEFAAVLLVAGVAASAGVLPYIHQFDPDEITSASAIAWIGYIGPVVAAAVLARAAALVPAASGAFGAMLIGVGVLNVAWGCLASWRTEKGAAAWHYSFMADWGLALCGFGLGLADGRSAAVLVLYSILLGRLPLYLWSRQALRERTQTDRPINLLAAAMLAGSAPFTGFAARVLLLRGATQLYWPLALVLAIGMLLWLPPSLRLGRSLGMPRGRQAVGVGIALALNVAIGLYPQPVLSLAGQ